MGFAPPGSQVDSLLLLPIYSPEHVSRTLNLTSGIQFGCISLKAPCTDTRQHAPAPPRPPPRALSPPSNGVMIVLQPSLSIHILSKSPGTCACRPCQIRLVAFCFLLGAKAYNATCILWQPRPIQAVTELNLACMFCWRCVNPNQISPQNGDLEPQTIQQ